MTSEPLDGSLQPPLTPPGAGSDAVPLPAVGPSPAEWARVTSPPTAAVPTGRSMTTTTEMPAMVTAAIAAPSAPPASPPVAAPSTPPSVGVTPPASYAAPISPAAGASSLGRAPAGGWSAPTPDAHVPPESTGPSRALLAVLATMALVLVGLGIGFGFFRGDSTTSVTAEDESVVFENEFATDEAQVEDSAETGTNAPADDGDADSVDATPSNPALADMPDATLEPVAFVARTVGPSVVLLQTAVGQGSGIIYDESGLIVTNAHVVGTATTLEIVLASGFRLDGTVVGSDPDRDVAVVSFDPGGLDFAVADIGLLETVEVGQVAVAIGSPFGLDQTVTAGIVSALGRSVPGRTIPVQMIQTDASINPGNSGGALADREGRVIGMNTSIRTDGVSSTNAGVGFAIPADTFLDIANRLVNGESLQSGFLGVNVQNPTSGEAGALITSVEPGSPAADGGIEIGDLIISVEGSRITDTSELVARVTLGQPGEPTAVELLRSGELVELEVVLGSR